MGLLTTRDNNDCCRKQQQNDFDLDAFFLNRVLTFITYRTCIFVRVLQRIMKYSGVFFEISLDELLLFFLTLLGPTKVLV